MNDHKPRTDKAQAVEEILDAATEVFAEVGFEGARVDAIARRAGVNKAMIYYRIGDKATLYAEVLHRTFSGTAERLLEELGKARTPEEKIRLYIRTFARTIRDNPHLPPMMLREMASGGKHMPDLVLGDLGRILLILKDLLEEGERAGDFISVHPIVFHLMVVGPISMRSRLDKLTSRRSDFTRILREIDQDHLDVFGEIEDMILKGLKA